MQGDDLGLSSSNPEIDAVTALGLRLCAGGAANNNANQYVAQTPTPPAQQYSQGNPFAVRPSLDAMPQSSEANVINFQPMSMMGQGMNMQQQGVPRDILTS